MMAFETREYGGEGSRWGRDRSISGPRSARRARLASRHTATPRATVSREMTREITKSA